MNSNIYRCGYCGEITDSDGYPLRDGAWQKAVRIMETYGEHRVEAVQGECCHAEQEDRRVQVTREMAMDAGDPRLEGQWINW